MTYSIRTKCGEIWLKDWIGYGYYDYVKEEQRDEILDEIFQQCVAYVNDRLPGGLIWFPYISEVYVRIDSDGEDVEDVDELIDCLTDEYTEKLNDLFNGDVDLNSITAFWEASCQI